MMLLDWHSRASVHKNVAINLSSLLILADINVLKTFKEVLSFIAHTYWDCINDTIGFFSMLQETLPKLNALSQIFVKAI